MYANRELIKWVYINESTLSLMEAANEKDLIRLAQSGDRETFCQLVKQYERRVYVLALYYCRDHYDAEDLSQEVWLKVYKAINGFRGESSFYTWLRQIVINTFIKHKAGVSFGFGRKRFQCDIEEADRIEHSGLAAVARREEAEERLQNEVLVSGVMDALGELTSQQRLIFLLKHREGMSCEEISKELGCSAGTVKKSLFRAVTKLRKHFGVRCESGNLPSIA